MQSMLSRNVFVFVTVRFRGGCTQTSSDGEEIFQNPQRTEKERRLWQLVGASVLSHCKTIRGLLPMHLCNFEPRLRTRLTPEMVPLSPNFYSRDGEPIARVPYTLFWAVHRSKRFVF
ncbi:hypothetical protein TNCV_903811 [Trichonephila clavipes]|nr:hypothetical protein TNCV_903811 [Trichonephila clavipes]